MTATLTSTPTDPFPGPTSDGPPPRAARRAGGVAALVKAATYLVGFLVLGAYLAPEGFGDGTPAESVAFVVDHQAVLYAWNAVLYLLGGVALLVLVLVLHERLRAAAPLLARTATALGAIWSGLLLAAGMIALVGQRAVVDLHATSPDQAVSAWVAVDAVREALGGGIELVGGAWVLLLAVAGLRWRVLGRRLSVLGLVVGVAGVLTVVPALEPLAAVFGLGLLVWFVGVGVVLLGRRPSPTR